MKSIVINTFNKVKNNKRLLYVISLSVLLLFCLALNVTFSLFTNSSSQSSAIFKVKNMQYSMNIDGVSSSIITAPANGKVKKNVSITALNKYPSKYELYYHICATEACETYIDKPAGLKIKYSSRTIDLISGLIDTKGNKNMRIVITNTTGTTYYVKLDINAGYSHNTLSLKNLIPDMYDEDDLIVAAYVDGTMQESFPTNNSYSTSVTCTVNGAASNATPSLNWDGTKWTFDVTTVDTGETRCNINFNSVSINQFNTTILTNNGGASSISAKGIPSFNFMSTTNDGMYAGTDNYGTTYYFRGAINNNWVKFGKNSSGYDMYWRIIRINGDGTIRMIFSGTTAPTSSTATVMTGSGTYTSLGYFNTSKNYAEYVGYKYAISNAHGTTQSSSIYSNINSWYTSNLASYSNYLANEIFCNDRTMTSGDGMGTRDATTFTPYTRLSTNKAPIFTCSNTSDQFTAPGASTGNAALANPIATITADEIAFAGGVYGTSATNTSFYLYTNQNYWTMSPNDSYTILITGGTAEEIVMTSSGYLSTASVATNSTYGYRPVINLKVNVGVSGTGTWDDPYEIKQLIT